MNLYKEQLRLQKNSLEELEEKYSKKDKIKKNRNFKYIEEFRKSYLLPISEALREELEDGLENITKKLFEKNRDEIEKEIIKEEISGNQLEKLALEVAKNIIELISSKKITPTKIYSNDIKHRELTLWAYNKFIEQLLNIYDKSITNIEIKQSKQLLALATIPLSSEEIIMSAFISLFQLFLKNSEDDEEHITSGQNICKNIGEEIFEQVNFRVRMYKDKDIEKFTNEDIVQIGALILKHLTLSEEESNLPKILKKNESINGKFEYYEFTEEFEEKSENFFKRMLKFTSPFFEPMIVKPNDWTTIDDGGFLKGKESSSKFNLKIMKTTTKNDLKNLNSIKDNFPKKLLEAINAIQNTKWQINKDILDYVEKEYKVIKKDIKNEMKQYKKERKKITENIKEKKVKIETTKELLKELNPDEELIQNKTEPLKKDLKKLKKIKKEIKVKILKEKNRLRFYETILNIAKKYQKYNEIYFVWQIDFRGRAYPVQPFLNPQGEDVSKALLHFAQKKEIDEKAIKWFKIHGANCYGKDKLSFEERINWVDENKENILNIFKYENPLIDSKFLKEADDKYQFLAFAIEYKEYIKDPKNFKSSLPIAVDGSNNGFQHITALLRDVKGAKKVNVLPTDSNKPADIYQDVADKTKEYLEKKLKEFEQKKDNYIFENGYYYTKKEITIRENFIETIEPLLKESIELYVENDKNFSYQEVEKKIRDKILLEKSKYKEIAIDYLEKIIEKTYKKLKTDDISNLLQACKETLKKDKEAFENSKKDYEKNEDGFYVIYKKEKVPQQFIKKILDSKIVDRKMVKKSVMTESYGAGKKAKRIQFIEYLEEEEIAKKHKLNEEDTKIIAQFIADINEKSIKEEISSAKEYKKWMQKEIADKISNLGKPIKWTTPFIHFTVIQEELETREKRIVYGKGNTMQIQIPTNKIDKKAQRKAIAPNFIHSLDATHMYMSILEAKERGIDSFATIHDSFATHAKDLETLVEILKETFIKLTKHDVLKHFKEEIEKNYLLTIAEIPYSKDKEDFNIELIKKSKYFFS